MRSRVRALVATCIALAAAAPVRGQMHGMSAGAERVLRALVVGRAGDLPLPSAARTGTGSAPVEGNVRVNDPGADTPELTTQNEVSLAVSGSTICAGFNDTGIFPSSSSGFARSTDGGLEWSDGGVTAPTFQLGDPALAVHQRSGTFYYAGLALLGSTAPSDSILSIISVARSTDGCQSFATIANGSPGAGGGSICAAPASAECRRCRRNSDCDTRSGAGDGLCRGVNFEDKPWIAVDNSGGAHDGNVYLCWSRFINQVVSERGELLFSRSSDGGLTFTGETVISPASDEFPHGCHIAVGADGEVYVAWVDRSADSPVRFRRSRDGGASWDPVVQVNHAPIRHPGIDRIVGCGSQTFCNTTFEVERPTLNGDVRMAAQAWMAVDSTGGRHHGNVYLAWADDPEGSADNSDIYVTHSRDRGATWSREMQIGGGSATDQFEPFLAVGGEGTVAIVWYDRRNDPANLLIDVYNAFSFDGGESFGEPGRVTTTSFPVPPLTGQPTESGNFDPSASACYMGEYIAAAGDRDYFYFAWGDNRDVVTSALYPSGRPDPNVFFARQPVPSPPSPTATVTFTSILAATATRTPSRSPTRTPTRTPTCAPAPLAGDCDRDGRVSVDEVILGVDIALGLAPLSECRALDDDASETVTVNEIVAGLANAMRGCSG